MYMLWYTVWVPGVAGFGLAVALFGLLPVRAFAASLEEVRQAYAPCNFLYLWRTVRSSDKEWSAPQVWFRLTFVAVFQWGLVLLTAVDIAFLPLESAFTALRPLLIFVLRCLVFDLSNLARDLFGCRCKVYSPVMYSVILGTFVAFSISSTTKTPDFLQYIVLDWVTFAFKVWCPMALGDHHPVTKRIKRLLCWSLCAPPQGTDKKPYPKKPYRFYCNIQETHSMSIGFTVLLGVYPVAKFVFPVLGADSMIFEFLFPNGFVSFIFLTVMLVGSILEDLIIATVAFKETGHTFRNATSWSTRCGKTASVTMFGSMFTFTWIVHIGWAFKTLAYGSFYSRREEVHPDVGWDY